MEHHDYYTIFKKMRVRCELYLNTQIDRIIAEERVHLIWTF